MGLASLENVIVHVDLHLLQGVVTHIPFLDCPKDRFEPGNSLLLLAVERV